MLNFSHTHNITDGGQSESITLFSEGGIFQATDTHPNFDKIVQLCYGGASSSRIEPLFDVSETVRRIFADLSDRVAVNDGEVYFDGEVAEPVISKQIIRLLDEGAPVRPLVKFMENIDENPSFRSRKQAFAWLNHHDITIDDDGFVIGYKGVSSDGQGGYRSGFSGTATVNGKQVTGRIPNSVGDVITMPRTAIDDDPNSACSSGLHIGTFSYAQGYSHSGAMLKVRVNPKDIVSVPHDAAGEKIRVARYEVLAIINGPVTSAYEGDSSSEWDWEDERPFRVGDKVIDVEGDKGVIVRDRYGDLGVQYDDGTFVTIGEAIDVYDIRHA